MWASPWESVCQGSTRQTLFLPVHHIFPFLQVTKYSVFPLGNCLFAVSGVLVRQSIPHRYLGKGYFICRDWIRNRLLVQPGQLETYWDLVTDEGEYWGYLLLFSVPCGNQFKNAAVIVTEDLKVQYCRAGDAAFLESVETVPFQFH